MSRIKGTLNINTKKSRNLESYNSISFDGHTEGQTL